MKVIQAIRAMVSNIVKRINWQFNLGTWLELALLCAIVPVLKWADADWFTENGLVENIQIMVLAVAAIIAFCAKYNRRLFVLAALILIFMIMRETNLFRGYFCAKYISAEEACKWSQFKYGYVAVWFKILFVVYIIYYFIRHKLWRIVWQYVQKAPFWVWDLLFLGLGIVGGTVAEFKSIDNETLEEMCELISYVALANCVYRYSKI